MVDPVGLKATAAIDRRPAPVAPVAAAQPVQPSVQADASRAAPTTLQALSQPAAQSAPVDGERVAKIKKAIQDGHFPLLPATVADRLLAFKLQWKPHDPA